MNKIETITHGFLDYIIGAFLIAAPWIFSFDTDNPESDILIILGVALVLYSLFTSYELGVVRLISMPVHLTMDVVSGIILAASPWIFGFADRVFLPHLILGLLEIIIALMTRSVAVLK